MSEIRKSHPELYNIVSLSGFLIAVVGTGLIILLVAADLMADFQNPYLGIITYFLSPLLVMFGLIIAALGARRARRRLRAAAGEAVPAFPVINLNEQPQRRLFVSFILLTSVFVVALALAAVKGYDFTESPTFCGKLCHRVMEPEYTAWSRSPHARVKCVECHIGPGAKWFVKSKLSGVRQVFAVAAGTYPKPIPVPIENLRPSRETCEHCHWPNKLYLEKTKVFYHYALDEANTPREVRLSLKIGGAFTTTRERREIHWHINKNVSYVARDRSRQDIPYVTVTDARGKTTEYVDTTNPPSGDVIRGDKRLMDCLDCHNRPTHIFRSPAQEIDRAFVAGRLDRELPFIKKVGIDLLSKPYPTTEEAMVSIATGVEYHLKNYPDVTSRKGASIKQAIDELRYIFRKNVFPGMNVRWSTYANNIGHVYSTGCFRCHDGKHRSRDGRVIPKQCTTCHDIIGQKQENIPPGTRVTEFVHPADIGEDLMNVNCSDCHGATGGA